MPEIKIDELVGTVGFITGMIGTTSPDTAVQIVSVISSIACLFITLIRIGIQIHAAIKAYRSGDMSTDDVLNALDEIRDKLEHNTDTNDKGDDNHVDKT